MSTTVYPSIYVFIGCPGSGKGTCAQAIKSEGYDHISTGNITREEVRRETEFGLRYKEVILNHIDNGIPFEEIQNLVEQRLNKAISGQRGIILDGYPKTKEQCELLDEFIEKSALQDKVVFVYLHVKEEDAIERIQYRQTCDKCDKVYNSKFSPSKNFDECDECHTPLTKRAGDNSDGAKKRVYEFKKKIEPVLEYYTKDNRLQAFDDNLTFEKFLSFHRSLSKI